MPDGTGLDIRRSSDIGHLAGLPTLAVDRSRYKPKQTVMNPIRHIRRTNAVLAGLAAALLACGATPAFARVMPPPGDAGYAPSAPVPAQIPAPVRTVTHTVVAGGMHGWQIALIAVGAALLAAALAVLADRALAAHRRTAATAA
jgi:hypothetical protein